MCTRVQSQSAVPVSPALILKLRHRPFSGAAPRRDLDQGGMRVSGGSAASPVRRPAEFVRILVHCTAGAGPYSRQLPCYTELLLNKCSKFRHTFESLA